MNPGRSRTLPSAMWYASRTTARLAFSRLVKWREAADSRDALRRSAPLMILVPTFPCLEGLAACDSGAPMATPRPAVATPAVIVFQLGIFFIVIALLFRLAFRIGDP